MAEQEQTGEGATEEELLRLLVENVKDYAVFVVGPDGRVRSWNPGAERLLGYRADEIVGRPAATFFTPEDIEAGVPEQEMRQALEEGRGEDDRWHVRKDGSRFWSGGTMTPLWDDGGALRGFAKIMRDRTEWKRADDARQASEERFRGLMEQAPFSVQVFAPDGRTLRVNRAWEELWGVTFDQVGVYNVLEDPQLEAKGVLPHIRRAFAGEPAVIPAMRGKIELRPERVELAAVVARGVETARPVIDARGHELTISVPAEPLSLDADPVRLTQVVGNLLTNAAKYTDPGGRITVAATREGGEAVLRVRDTGIGIAPDILPRVFDLFVQVDHAATRSQGGLGIGLTLVKNLVEMHHGSAEARSEGLGKGSEFVVRLPLSVREERPGPESGDRQLGASSPARRLLVVDDNVDAAESLAVLLRMRGHEVRVAHDGPAALKATAGYRPAVVFLDIGMPGMDGYEVARRLRRQPDLGGVVLIALTGWGQPEDRRRSREAGFDHHLVKPVDPTAFDKLLADPKVAR